MNDRDPDVFYGRGRPWGREPDEAPKKEKGMPPTPGMLNSLIRDEAHWSALTDVSKFIREHGAIMAARVLKNADELLKKNS